MRHVWGFVGCKDSEPIDFTPLHPALDSETRDVEVVRPLLEHGADKNCQYIAQLLVTHLQQGLFDLDSRRDLAIHLRRILANVRVRHQTSLYYVTSCGLEKYLFT